MNEYDRFARLYHLEHRDLREDIAFYLHLAERCDGPVLELGCGSGRVSLALAQQGYHVTGIDSSAAMLDLARTRAQQADLTARLRLEHLDVRRLAFEAQFALAIYPLNGFLHLLSATDQRAALCNIRRALLPGGILALALPNPHVVLAPQVDGQVLLRRRFRTSDGLEAACYTIAQTDLAAQRQLLTLLYDESAPDGTLHRTVVDTELRFVYRYEMVLLLESAGLALDGLYGSYDLDPYDADSEVMLVLAYRPASAGA
ncbi:MAG: class I SAM-dependent methyltransferase [Anaerolineae bacterium]|nr:class I SAM-dependent methyltransferase [Anaerolineae bacterium]